MEIKKNKVFETDDDVLRAGIKARWEEGGGRILLGDDGRRDGPATADQVTVYRILDSTGLPCVHECGWPVCTQFRLAQNPTCIGPSGTL